MVVHFFSGALQFDEIAFSFTTTISLPVKGVGVGSAFHFVVKMILNSARSCWIRLVFVKAGPFGRT